MMYEQQTNFTSNRNS